MVRSSKAVTLSALVQRPTGLGEGLVLDLEELGVVQRDGEAVASRADTQVFHSFDGTSVSTP